MKAKAFFILLMLALLARAEDELISVDSAAGMITIQQGGTLKTYRLRPFTDITINGLKASVALLKPGMQVTIALADPQTASKVTAKGNLAAASTPAPTAAGATPKPFFNSLSTSQSTRRIVFKGSIDAGDDLIIQNGKLHIQHIDWSKPKDITINGIKWQPQWNGNTSDDFTGFTPPLASFAGASVTVKKVKARGVVTVLEPPTESNAQKLVIHLNDDGPGASEFEVRITW